MGIRHFVAVIFIVCVPASAWPQSLANPAAIEDLKAGRRGDANAAWWGFNAQDATESLQAAIDSGARRVTVPFVGADWIVRPIRLRGNLELVFEPGVNVEAKKGEFKGTGDSLFSANDASGIAILGYGATLRMHKPDYQKEPYAKGEWRMTLDLQGCRNIRIEGLRLESSGGDGIYIGATTATPYCENVEIRNVVCHDHHRQGISVISAVNLLIENCVLSSTEGTAPEAGIDLEPNSPNEKLVNVVVRNCIMENNDGAGMLVYLKPLTRESEPVSILFENCHVRNGKDQGMAVGAIGENGVDGLIEFRNCTVENTRNGGTYVYDKHPDRARVRFTNCKWRNVATNGSKRNPGAPILLSLQRESLTKIHGGIEFDDCAVFDDRDRPCLVAEEDQGEPGIQRVSGSLYVANPNGARAELGNQAKEIDLRILPQ